ncbi:MAG: hypothetical protein O7B35_15470 [Deltaproteobacteria bacterium]|nr:hypothetical protein [Deltaproteobacteria bacterium]
MARHMVVFNVCSPHSLAVLTELKAQVDRDVEPVSTLLSPKSVCIKVIKPDSGEGIPSKSIRIGLHPHPRLKKLEKEWGWD